jgi:hypothetical protein
MDVMPSLVQMEKEELQKLIAEVKETVATVIQLPEANQKTFGHLDMWNIRRNFKTTGDLLSRK